MRALPSHRGTRLDHYRWMISEYRNVRRIRRAFRATLLSRHKSLRMMIIETWKSRGQIKRRNKYPRRESARS